MIDIKYVFVVVYLVVDILYVTLSKGFYEKVVTNIQGKSFPTLTLSRKTAAALSYSFMVIGWLFLVLPALDAYVQKGQAPWKAGLITGLLYGVLVYGVFNGTNHVMFDKWDVRTSLRDFLWGVSWGTTLTIMYAIVKYRK